MSSSAFRHDRIIDFFIVSKLLGGPLEFPSPSISQTGHVISEDQSKSIKISLEVALTGPLETFDEILPTKRRCRNAHATTYDQLSSRLVGFSAYSF